MSKIEVCGEVYDEEWLQQALGALMSLHTVVENEEMGICDNVMVVLSSFCGDTNYIIQDIGETWEHFSGDRQFPVPASIPYRETDPYGLTMYVHTVNLWDNTPYGDARRAFLVYLCDIIQNSLDKEK